MLQTTVKLNSSNIYLRPYILFRDGIFESKWWDSFQGMRMFTEIFPEKGFWHLGMQPRQPGQDLEINDDIFLFSLLCHIFQGSSFRVAYDTCQIIVALGP